MLLALMSNKSTPYPEEFYSQCSIHIANTKKKKKGQKRLLVSPNLQ